MMMDNKRTFSSRQAHVCYPEPPSSKMDHGLYDSLSDSAWDNIKQNFTVPAQSGKAWEMKAGQTCRIITQGPQVGELNFWSLHDFRERFYSGKTRQIQSIHLTVYDQLWSNMPYLRPIATITKDTLRDYGVDKDGCSIHDVIGTRCDPYTDRVMYGSMSTMSCHQFLLGAVKTWELQEPDIHDAFSIFSCKGINPKTHKMIAKTTPAEKGDFIEFVADIDLLVALSVCPHGDGLCDSNQSCQGYPMDVYLGQPNTNLVQKWRKSKFMA